MHGSGYRVQDSGFRGYRLGLRGEVGGGTTFHLNGDAEVAREVLVGHLLRCSARAWSTPEPS